MAGRELDPHRRWRHRGDVNAPQLEPGAAEFAGVATDSRTVAAWTLVSRITGFGRVATLAAVLGPTYFGNLFQTGNHLPNIIHEVLTGSLMTALLVPPLVRHVVSGDPHAVRRLANGVLGVVVLVFSAVVVLGVVAAPLLVGLLTIGVADAGVRAAQHRLGWPLLAMVLPQIVLYGIAATAVAVQHAHRRFALAAAAPALENLGVTAVLAASAALFGFGVPIDQIGTPQLLLLGVGSTVAVAIHAAIQWWGACRVGVPLVPTAGWRDAEVRRIVRLAIPSSGYAALDGLSFLGLLVVAGSVPGGAVALHVGYNFFNLPVAVCARPVGAAQLPRLAQSFNRNDLAAFHATYRSSLALTLFVALPAALIFLGIPEALARAASFGEMATSAGIALVAAAIGSLGLGIVGESAFIVATSASYARRDALSPLRAMALRATIVFAGLALALTLMEGVAVLVTLGGAVSAATLVAAAYLHRRQIRALPRLAPRLDRWPLPDAAAAAVAVIPGVLAAEWLEGSVATTHQALGVGMLAIALSGITYLAVQWLRGSQELNSLLATFLASRPIGAPGGSRPERAAPRAGARAEPPL